MINKFYRLPISEYSKKEMKMIRSISPNIADLAESNETLSPVTILEMTARQAFIDDVKGPAVESLRRCMKSIRDCNPYRNTPEYEQLIQL